MLVLDVKDATCTLDVNPSLKTTLSGIILASLCRKFIGVLLGFLCAFAAIVGPLKVISTM